MLSIRFWEKINLSPEEIFPDIRFSLLTCFNQFFPKIFIPSFRFNQDKAIYNLLNAGADFSTVDNQGRTALYTAVSVSAIESVQAILNHPTSGLSPFCYLPNTLQDSTTPLIQAIKLGDTGKINYTIYLLLIFPYFCFKLMNI